MAPRGSAKHGFTAWLVSVYWMERDFVKSASTKNDGCAFPRSFERNVKTTKLPPKRWEVTLDVFR